MIAPVVLFVYNRPRHTQKTLQKLDDNYLVDKTNLYIFSDGPKTEKDEEKITQTREVLEHFLDNNSFKSVNIINSNVNKGLAQSVIEGVSEVINVHKKVIVIEDDLLTTKNFLTFMNAALDFYEEQLNIWSISGYNIPIKIPNGYNEDVYFSYRGSSWGWGTWLNRWKTVDWDVSDYQEFKYNNQMRKRFNLGGRDMSNMLDLQMSGKIDSWAIRWCYSQFIQNKLTVYPVDSKIYNIGLDGTGTHRGNTSKYHVTLKDKEKIDFVFVNPKINKEIIRNFRNHYMSYLSYILIKPKQFLKDIIRKLPAKEN